MKAHARVVIIGGGVAGASVAYHLTHLGWSDVVLLEQGDLADGTTWHSAGHCILPYQSRHMTRFTKESIELYRSLEAETGQSTGFIQMGSLTVASTPDRVDELKKLVGAARVEEVPFELISCDDARKLWPWINYDDVLTASFSPTAGRVDPTGATIALAAGARLRGASVERKTRVTGTRKLGSGEWEIETTSGRITCEYVVNAAGQWSRSLASLAGIDLPLVPVEHQYVITATIPELVGQRLPHFRDPDSGFYLRQDGDGILVGMYEHDARIWGLDRVPSDFLHSLLPSDIDRISEDLQRVEKRVPIIRDAGIRTVLNGPDAYSSDDRFLMGPVPEDGTYFAFAGFNSAGVQTAAGAARYLAEWIVDGEPSMDVADYDARRFGSFARSTAYLSEGAIETYRRHFMLRYPIEERESGRGLRTSPIHDILSGRGAVFGERFGWERPIWFARGERPPVDEPSFRRPSWFGAVRDECLAVHDRVGILDQTSFAKHQVKGPGAAEFLDRLVATQLPPVGRTAYGLLLTELGHLANDLTITRLAGDAFYLVSAAAGETRDGAWLRSHAPSDGSVDVQTVTTDFGVLTVAGPLSRKLLSRACGRPMEAADFPYLAWRELPVGSALVTFIRVSYSGELGWELHVPMEYMRYVYLALLEAGRDLGVVDFGYRALDAMGLEMGYPQVGADMNSEHTPYEAGLARFVRTEKWEFVGSSALKSQQAEETPSRLTCLLFPEGDDAVPYGMEPVNSGDETISYVIRGGFGHRVDRAIAYAYLPAEYAQPDTHLCIEILGERHSVTVSAGPTFDPKRRREPR